MIIEHIAPNRIISLTKRTRTPSQLYRWMEGKVYHYDRKSVGDVIKELRNKNYTLEWGFFTMGWNGLDRLITSEELIKNGYLVDETAVYYKPYIEIKYDEGTNRLEFDSDSEMESTWDRLQRLIPNAIKIENGKLK